MDAPLAWAIIGITLFTASIVFLSALDFSTREKIVLIVVRAIAGLMCLGVGVLFVWAVVSLIMEALS